MQGDWFVLRTNKVCTCTVRVKSLQCFIVRPHPSCRVLSAEDLFIVTVTGNIQARRLQLLDTGLGTSGRELHCISFGHAYYGMVVSRKALLFNDSPVTTDYLAVLDGQAEGSEHGVDQREGLALACTTGGLGQSRWREQGHTPPTESLLSVTPPQVLPSFFFCAK